MEGYSPVKRALTFEPADKPDIARLNMLSQVMDDMEDLKERHSALNWLNSVYGQCDHIFYATQEKHHGGMIAECLKCGARPCPNTA